jgi:hypothetical protein
VLAGSRFQDTGLGDTSTCALGTRRHQLRTRINAAPTHTRQIKMPRGRSASRTPSRGSRTPGESLAPRLRRSPYQWHVRASRHAAIAVHSHSNTSPRILMLAQSNHVARRLLPRRRGAAPLPRPPPRQLQSLPRRKLRPRPPRLRLALRQRRRVARRRRCPPCCCCPSRCRSCCCLR